MSTIQTRICKNGHEAPHGKNCPDCGRTAALQHYHRNAPANYDKNRQRVLEWRLKKMGVTPEEVEQARITQQGLCAICGRHESTQKSNTKDGRDKLLAVDHCHQRMKFRGLLCDTCNRALGLVNDNIDTLRSMIDYLQSHEEN